MSWPLRLDEIYELHLEPSNYCNAFCPECSRAYDNSKGFVDNAYMKLVDVKKWFHKDNLPNLGQITLCGSYGDPIINPELEKIIKYFVETWDDMTVRIATNGGMRTVKWWNQLGELLNPYDHEVLFGIDGLEDTNEMYRIGVDWDRLEANYKSFIAGGGFAVWQFIVFPWNEHQIEEARQYAKEDGFKKFLIRISSREAARGVTEDKYKHKLELINED